MLPTRLLRQPSDVWGTPLMQLRDEIDRMFRDVTAEPMGVYGVYPVDIREDQNHLYIEAELPGFARDEIDVTLENGVLTIAAERKAVDHKGQQAHLTERRYTKVARRFQLPNTVDESTVAAKLEAGVLHLTLNKREEVKPRKIEVR